MKKVVPFQSNLRKVAKLGLVIACVLSFFSSLAEKKADSLYRKAYENFYTDLETALELNNKALLLYDNTRDNESISKCLVFRGSVFEKMDNKALAIESYYTSLKYKGNPYNQVAAHQNLGRLHKISERWSDAEAHYQEGLKIAKNLGSDDQASLYRNLGNLYRQRHKYLKAQEAYLKAIELSDQAGNKERIPALFNAVGICYKELGAIDSSNYKKARKYYDYALKSNPSTKYEALALHNIGWTYYLENDLELAKEYDTKALETSNDDRTKFICLKDLGTYSLEKGDTAEAIFHWKRAELFDQNLLEEDLFELYNDLAKASKASGNLEDYVKYNEIFDSKRKEYKLIGEQLKTGGIAYLFNEGMEQFENQKENDDIKEKATYIIASILILLLIISSILYYKRNKRLSS